MIDLEKLGFHLVFEKNKNNNELRDELIIEKTKNVKLFKKKNLITKKVNDIFQNLYEEINILKKEKRRLVRLGEHETNILSNCIIDREE